MSALSLAPPPAPNPTPQDTSSAFPSALATQPMGAQAQSPQPPQGQPPSPPSHAQTVAALRHFTAIEKETAKLLKNPDCGKADMRSAVIDGVTKLVSQGILQPVEAVTELSQFPDRPFDQKKWLEQHFVQTTQAQTAILALHQHGALGQPPDPTSPSMDDHHGLISGLGAQLRPTNA